MTELKNYPVVHVEDDVIRVEGDTPETSGEMTEYGFVSDEALLDADRGLPTGSLDLMLEEGEEVYAEPAERHTPPTAEEKKWDIKENSAGKVSKFRK